jgi:hypothetical protein
MLVLVGIVAASRCAAVLEPSPEQQRERLEVLTEAESGYWATTESCVGGVILGEISNFSGTRRTYAVASTVPDGVERLSEFVSLEHTESAEWRIDAPVFGQQPCELSAVYVLE